MARHNKTIETSSDVHTVLPEGARPLSAKPLTLSDKILDAATEAMEAANAAFEADPSPFKGKKIKSEILAAKVAEATNLPIATAAKAVVEATARSRGYWGSPRGREAAKLKSL